MNLIPKYFVSNSFEDMFSFPIMRNGNFMKADITKKDDNYIFEIDIPGFNKEDITVDYNKGYLTVKVKKEENKSDDNKEYVRRERLYGEYERSFYVGDIDDTQIKASYENGLLEVQVPTEVESRKNQKSIEIE